MASMSYCKFENTTPDLWACVDSLEKGEVLNQYEEPYRHQLYEAAKAYIEAYENYEPKEKDEDDED